ncbi:MAG: DUF177 domain-containing protein [Synergistaceae bacterium]|jgi:uncharacterized protein|nr:DUF177 domain-containing protein [Synergistaceae bacterium]
MKRYAAPPEEWDCGILLSNIRKNGEPHGEVLELPIHGSVEYWGQSYAAKGPLSVRLTANYAGENIVVLVEIKGKFSLPCSRCLKETILAIDGNMRYLFTLRHPVDGGKRRGRQDDGTEADEPDGDVDVIYLDGYQAELDLSHNVWETLILNLPERALCMEDCLGLCPVCGCDRNAFECGCSAEEGDPRFGVLRGFE